MDVAVLKQNREVNVLAGFVHAPAVAATATLERQESRSLIALRIPLDYDHRRLGQRVARPIDSVLHSLLCWPVGDDRQDTWEAGSLERISSRRLLLLFGKIDDLFLSINIGGGVVLIIW